MIREDAETPLAIVGCDFRVASSHWRSMLVLDDAVAQKVATELKRNSAADGFVDLNTCNRNEWIISSPSPSWAAELLRTQMKHLTGEEAQQWIEPYVLVGEEAARHIFNVAIGQESLVVGERQIAGQLFRALETARARGTSSRVLNGLGSIAGRLVRIAIRRGCVGNTTHGVHSLAISYLRKHFQKRKGIKIAIIGLGSIGRRILGFMEEDTSFIPIPCNRTIREELTGKVRPLERLAETLEEVDGAVVCTGAPRPVILPEHLKPRSKERPLLLLDIGIPEQVSHHGMPEKVTLAGLDELVSFHNGQEPDAQSLNQACANHEVESLVKRAVAEFKVFCREHTFSEILDTVQRHHHQLVREEIPRLIESRLGYLPETDLARLELDLRNIVLEYTSEVFRTIKETSKRHAECVKWPKKP